MTDVLHEPIDALQKLRIPKISLRANLNTGMLHDASITCNTRQEFDDAIATAVQLCLQGDYPVKLNAHCSPTGSGGSGNGGMMFGMYIEVNGQIKQVLHAIHTTFVVEHDVFEVSYDLKDSMRKQGLLVGFSDWETERVSHVLTLPWNGCDIEYGMVGSDQDAIEHLFRFNGTQMKKIELVEPEIV